MVNKHKIIMLLVFILYSCNSLIAQSGTYFNKKYFVSFSPEIRIFNNDYSGSKDSGTPPISLEFGQILWYNTMISVSTTYQHEKYSRYLRMTGTSDNMLVKYVMPNISLGFNMDYYYKGGSAPKGPFVSIGSRLTRYHANVISYENQSTQTIFTEDIESSMFNLPSNHLKVYIRGGVGFTKLLNHRSLIRIESIFEFSPSDKSEFLTFDPGFSTLFKVGYVYFLF